MPSVREPSSGSYACADRVKRSNPAERWRSFLTVDDETALYCPECAEREFGES